MNAENELNHAVIGVGVSGDVETPAARAAFSILATTLGHASPVVFAR
jgi:hypothetical protein